MLTVVALLLMAIPACRSPWIDREFHRRETELYGDRGARSVEGAPLETWRVTPPGEEAELDSYLAFGLANNAGLRSAFETWRAAMEVIPQVTALPDPRFTFGQFIESIETRTGPQEQTFGLSQTFPWFGKLEGRGEVRKLEARRLWQVVQARRLAAELEIRDSFHEYQYLATAIRITEDNLALLKRLEPVAQRKIQGGDGQSDLLRVQVEIGKIENDLESLRKFRIPISSRLRAAMNWRVADPLPWPAFKDTRPLELDRTDLREQLLETNPEIEALREDVRKQTAAIELAALEAWPDITLGANYIATDTARMPGVAGSGDDPFFLTLSLNLPVQRARYHAAVREAENAKAAAVSALAQKENDLVARLEMKSYELDDAFRQIALYEDSLIPRARQALEVTEVAYRAGTATLTDLIDSQRVLLTFEKSLTRARANHAQSLAAIEALCGGSTHD